jgi:hypothetical protein
LSEAAMMAYKSALVVFGLAMLLAPVLIWAGLLN